MSRVIRVARRHFAWRKGKAGPATAVSVLLALSLCWAAWPLPAAGAGLTPAVARPRAVAPLPPPEAPSPDSPVDAEPDRTDCESIRGTEYRSFEERAWFLANCIRTAPAQGQSTVPAFAHDGPVYVTAIGDSVMLGAAAEMSRNIAGVYVDAAVSRQVSTAISILRRELASGQLGMTVVLHIGNNGTFSAAQFEEIMAVAGPDRRVIFMSLKLDRWWEEPNNIVIADGVARHPSAALLDWRSASIDRPELFWSDLIHLRPEGARYYCELLLALLGG